MKKISITKANETHEKLREILIKYGCEEYGDCIVDEISWLFGFPTTIDVKPEEDNFDAEKQSNDFIKNLQSANLEKCEKVALKAKEKSIIEKINIAKEAFNQWCDDDAEEEIKNWEKRESKSFDANESAFYIDLHNRGIRL